jgi:peptidoglycan/LPS O-acetylase OafA/YrhL
LKGHATAPASDTVQKAATDAISIVVPGEARVPEIVSLTSLRGIAAMLVALLHFMPQLKGYFPLTDYTKFFDRGYIWVDFFFILSGFVMCYVYGDMFADRVSKAAVKRFLILRFVRIYPLHFATLMMFVAAELAQLVLSWHYDLSNLKIFADQSAPITILTNALLLHGYGINDVSGWNQPSWSISVEMGLYILFPFIAVSAFLQTGLGRLIAMIAAFIVLGVIEWNLGGLTATIKYGFFRGLGGFLLGMVVFHSRTLAALPRAKYLNGIQALLVLGVIMLLHFKISDVLVMPLFALIIAAVRTDAGWLAALLRTRPLYILGVLSYSIYMTHNLIVLAFSPRWVLVFPGLAPFIQSPWMVAVFFAEVLSVLAVSWFTYRYVERPARHYLRRRLLTA